jgi:membrane protein required for beta-lactamase induction
MTLLAILLGLSIEKMMPTLLEYRRYDWFFGYQQWMHSKLSQIANWNDTLSFTSIIVVPTILVSLIHYQLYHMTALLGFLFSVVVLAYCLGPEDIYGVAKRLVELEDKEDDPSDLRSATAVLFNAPLPEDDHSLYRTVNQKLLISTNNCILAVLFWFSVLGPMGAILYRLAYIAHKSNIDNEQRSEEYKTAAALFFAIINWIPAHLTALCFAVTGSFVDALHHWKESKVKNHLDADESESMLADVGLGSLHYKEASDAENPAAVKAVLALAKRSVILWLTALALLTMSGWTS